MEIHGRVFRAGDLIRSILLMCGGHYNEFYLSAQSMAIAEVIYLFEHWVELRETLNKRRSE